MMFSVGRFIAPIKLRRRLLTSRWLACENGATAVEFGLIALPLFGLLIAIIQIGIVFLAQNELETAVEKASRQLLTGNAQQAGITQSQFLTTVCGYLPLYFTCSGVMADLQTVSSFSSANTSAPTLTYNSNGSVSNSWSFNAGGAGSTLVLRVFYQFPIVSGPMGFWLANLPNSSRLLMSTAVFQVEP